MEFSHKNFYDELSGINAHGNDKITCSWRGSAERFGGTRSRSRNCENGVISRRILISRISSDARMSDERCPSISERKSHFTVAKYLPVFDWLPRYTRLKAVSDVIAGITLGLTMIPQSMAYAVLAERIPQVSLVHRSFLVHFKTINTHTHTDKRISFKNCKHRCLYFFKFESVIFAFHYTSTTMCLSLYVFKNIIWH